MYVKGVGPPRASVLESKGIRTVEDLLSYAPFRYEDRSNVKPISQLAPGETATVIAQVRSACLAGFLLRLWRIDAQSLREGRVRQLLRRGGHDAPGV